MIGCWVGGVERASMSILHVWLCGRRCPYATPCSSQPGARVLVAATKPNTKRAANTAQPTPSAPPASEIPAWGLGVFFWGGVEGMVACSTQPTPSRLLPTWTWMVRRGVCGTKGIRLTRGERARPIDGWLATAAAAACRRHALLLRVLLAGCSSSSRRLDPRTEHSPLAPAALMRVCCPARRFNHQQQERSAGSGRACAGVCVCGARVQPTHAQPPDRSGGQARQRVRSGLRG